MRRRRVSAAMRRWVRVEAASLVVLTLVAVATWAFLELAEYANGGEPHELDRALLVSLRSASDPSDPIGPPWFEEMVRDVTALGGLGPLTLLTTVVLGYLVSKDRKRTAVLLAVSVVGGALVSFGLKELFDRARPDVVPHMMRVSTASFPSGHAMISTVVYLTLGAMLAQVQPGWWLRAYVLASAVTVAGLIGASRVYLGVHWPSDVAGGFAIGFAWAGLAWAAERRLQREGGIEPEPEEEEPEAPHPASPAAPRLSEEAS